MSSFILILEALPTPPHTENKANKTIAELVDQQTEAIKKIISSQKQGHVDYPIVTKTETNLRDTVNEKQITEDLRIRCQHLLEAQKSTTTVSTKQDRFDVIVDIKEAATEKPHGPLVKPDLLRFKPRFPTIQNHGETGTLHPTNNNSNIKLIRFEPVILQKTIMKDGQILYYWHKSLPYPQYLLVPQPGNSETEREDIRKQLLLSPTTTTSTTTTTTPKPTSTTQEPLYTEGLRFVVPIPYGNLDVTPKYPTDFDPFAYYPKYLQPQTVNVEVPYQSRFPVLKTLTIPNKYIQQN